MEEEVSDHPFDEDSETYGQTKDAQGRPVSDDIKLRLSTGKPELDGILEVRNWLDKVEDLLGADINTIEIKRLIVKCVGMSLLNVHQDTVDMFMKDELERIYAHRNPENEKDLDV